MSNSNRIERVTGNKTVPQARTSRRVAETGSKQFQSFLDLAAGQQGREQMAALLAQVDHWGEQLGRNPGMGTLKGFREAVRRFVQNALQMTYLIREEAFFDRSGRYKVLTVMERLDREMEQLTAAVLSQEIDRPGIKVMIEQLKGLLVDMLG